MAGGHRDGFDYVECNHAVQLFRTVFDVVESSSVFSPRAQL